MSELASPRIPARPALAPWYRIARDDGRVLFEHGGSVVTLEGRAADVLLPQLLPLLDGTSSVAQIVDRMGRPAEPSIRKALAMLADNGLLVDGPPRPVGSPRERTTAASFAAARSRQVNPTSAAEGLASARVALAGESLVAAEIARLLASSGLAGVDRVRMEGAAASGGFLVCAPTPAEAAGIAALNASRLAQGEAWLSVLPHDGRSLVVGPLYLPQESACHACFRVRRAAASGYEEDFDLVDAKPTRAACPAPVAAIAAGLAATLVLRWLAGRDATLPGRYYVLETGVVLALSFHHALRVPRCPACGPGDTSLPSPWFKETARDD